MILLGFRRNVTALALCKSIESAIQWFQIHHRITFATIRDLAVYLSGARVSIFSTLVPRLYGVSIRNLSSIGPVVSEEKMFENVDGRRSHWYTNSSPRSLRLR